MAQSRIRNIFILACAAAITACDHPSELHDFTDSDTAALRIAAQPRVALGPSEKLYVALALANQRTIGVYNESTEAKLSVETAQKISALLSAWCAEHGGLSDARRFDEASLDVEAEMYRMVSASLDALPTDAYLAQGALCFATRLRQEGTGLMSAMLGVAVLNKVRSQHPHPPAAWQSYALKDDELQHAFTSEAAAIRERFRGANSEGLVRHRAWTAAAQLRKAPATLAAMDVFARESDALFRRAKINVEVAAYVNKWKTASAEYAAWTASN